MTVFNPLTFLALFLLIGCKTDQEPGPLIPRSILFGNPEKTNIQISPNGKYISYLAPKDGILNIWVQKNTPHAPAHCLTHEKKRNLISYTWCYDNQHILFSRDDAGDENWKIYALNIHTNTVRPLFESKEKARTNLIKLSPNFPEDVLLSINDRDPAYHDVYRVNILSGKKTQVLKNNSFIGFLANRQLNLVFAFKIAPTGGTLIYRKTKNKWMLWKTISPEDTPITDLLSLSTTGKDLFWIDGTSRDKGALKKTNLNSGKTEVLFAPKKSEISSVFFCPQKNTPLFLEEHYLKPHYHFLAPHLKKDFSFLQKQAQGFPFIVSTSSDFSIWIVGFMEDNGPIHFYQYDRAKNRAHFLFTNRPELENKNLTTLVPFETKARDQLKLTGYFSLPYAEQTETHRPSKPLPLVLVVHGGPEARDFWGYNATAQWLNNRGYAFLCINYRGSAGFGKKFIAKGDKEWGGKMHDDLVDAVNWAIQEKIADPKRIAIFGGSYGGYATLVGLTKTPDLFCCGVDIVGPSNLETLLRTIPPYWKPAIAQLYKKLADPHTLQGRKFLQERSPLNFVSAIKKPLLIAQGANDPRVKKSESDQIVSAMKAKKIPVSYVVYPDEGHGFNRAENRMSFYALSEKFLSNKLGGKFEPIKDALKNSSALIQESSFDVT